MQRIRLPNSAHIPNVGESLVDGTRQSPTPLLGAELGNSTQPFKRDTPVGPGLGIHFEEAALNARLGLSSQFRR